MDDIRKLYNLSEEEIRAILQRSQESNEIPKEFIPEVEEKLYKEYLPQARAYESLPETYVNPEDMYNETIEKLENQKLQALKQNQRANKEYYSPENTKGLTNALWSDEVNRSHNKAVDAGHQKLIERSSFNQLKKLLGK